MTPFLVNVWNTTHRVSFKNEGEAEAWCREQAEERRALVTLYGVVDGHPVFRASYAPVAKASPRQKPARPTPEPVTPLPPGRTKAPQIVMPTVKKPAVLGPVKVRQGEVDMFDMLDD